MSTGQELELKAGICAQLEQRQELMMAVTIGSGKGH